jgi:hypothetical protein
MDEESKVLSVVTPEVRMAKKALKTLDNSNGIRISTRDKYHIPILSYDGFVVHHYTYMVRVIQEVEPTCFELETLNGTMPWMKR